VLPDSVTRLAQRWRIARSTGRIVNHQSYSADVGSSHHLQHCVAKVSFVTAAVAPESLANTHSCTARHSRYARGVIPFCRNYAGDHRAMAIVILDRFVSAEEIGTENKPVRLQIGMANVPVLIEDPSFPFVVSPPDT
jgi:hypothetical protein